MEPRDAENQEAKVDKTIITVSVVLGGIYFLLIFGYIALIASLFSRTW